jgi:catechol 2,3-dioxygenase-like lactoylglutathione lyase family enzyme
VSIPNHPEGADHVTENVPTRGIPTARNVDHVAFTVPNLQEAIDFFVEVIGGQLIYQLGPVQDLADDWMTTQLNVARSARCNIAMIRLGPVSNIELFEYEAPDQNRAIPRNSDWGGHHLAIYVDDIDAAVAYLRAQPGVTVLGQPQLIEDGPIAGDRWVYFLSPWGLQMEVICLPPGAPYERGTSARRYGPAESWHN